MKQLVILLFGLFILSGCEEVPLDQDERNRVEKYSGLWTVAKITTEVHDENGLKNSREESDIGILDIRVGSAWDSRWHELRIDSTIRNRIIPFYNIARGGALDAYGWDEYGCFWQDDLDGMRFYLEGTVGANHHVEVLNLEFENSRMVWTWYEAQGEMPNTLTRKQVIVLEK